MKAAALGILFAACASAHSFDSSPGSPDAGTGDAGTDAPTEPTPTGNGIWVRHGTGTGPALVRKVAVDAAGNIIAVGELTGTLDLGPAHFVAVGANDVFVVKYDSEGTQLWAHSLGGSDIEFDEQLVVAADGGIYVSRNERQPNNVNGWTTTAVLARYAADGTLEWSRTYGSPPGRAYIGAMAIDGNALAISGTTNMTMSMGPSVSVVVGVVESGRWFVARLDEHGDALWANAHQGSLWPWPVISMDGAQVLVHAQFASWIELDDGIVTGTSDPQMFLAAYDASSGALRWKHIYSDATGTPAFVSLVADGSMWLAGSFLTSPLDFGNGVTLVPSSSWDVYGAHLDADGNAVSAYRSDLGADGVLVLGAAGGPSMIVAGSLTSPNRAWIGRYAADGMPLWSHLISGPSSAASSVARTGNIVAVGGSAIDTVALPGIDPVVLGSDTSMPYIARIAP